MGPAVSSRTAMGVMYTVLVLGAVCLVVDVVLSWPPDLPWELVRYTLVALWVTVLTGMIIHFVRQSAGDRRTNRDGEQ